MKAFSIQQPWLDAILYGGKSPENRSWPLPPKYVGVRIALHASAALDRRAVLPDGIDTTNWPGIRGAILATGIFTGCHYDGDGCNGNCGTWGEQERFHWRPADLNVLPVPVPAKGSLQFWTPTPAVLDAVQQQTREGVTA